MSRVWQCNWCEAGPFIAPPIPRADLDQLDPAQIRAPHVFRKHPLCSLPCYIKTVLVIVSGEDAEVADSIVDAMSDEEVDLWVNEYGIDD